MPPILYLIAYLLNIAPSICTPLPAWTARLQRCMAQAGESSASPPPVMHDSALTSNARYLRDTIWVGQVQAAFSTADDTLSLLWHEYHHHKLRGRFPVKVDAEGLPVQWMTRETYLYQPPPEQVEQEMESTRAFLEALPDSQRHLHVSRLREELSAPRRLPFRYAPSNLAREEIFAYGAQLDGEAQGLYRLSLNATRTIRIRLYQLRQTLALRLDYEQRRGLGPNGG